jgi:DNA-binding beta-propeller fold protein YncE
MSHEEPVAHDTPPTDTVVQAQDTLVSESVDEQEEWLAESEALELPPRPRRRLLTPLPLALLGVLLLACGFIGGVLVEKGQSTSSSQPGGAASLASRFAALREGASGAGASGASARSGSSAAGGGLGGSSGSATGFSRPTAGTVAYLAGSTLYVTNFEGNTVKVTTSAGTSVTKTVKSAVKGIHPGETVTVTGATGADGAVNAESISVGSSGAGLAGLLGGSGARGGFGARGGSSGGGAGGGGASGEPALFGG